MAFGLSFTFNKPQPGYSLVDPIAGQGRQNFASVYWFRSCLGFDRRSLLSIAENTLVGLVCFSAFSVYDHQYLSSSALLAVIYLASSKLWRAFSMAAWTSASSGCSGFSGLDPRTLTLVGNPSSRLCKVPERKIHTSRFHNHRDGERRPPAHPGLGRGKKYRGLAAHYLGPHYFGHFNHHPKLVLLISYRNTITHDWSRKATLRTECQTLLRDVPACLLNTRD